MFIGNRWAMWWMGSRNPHSFTYRRDAEGTSSVGKVKNSCSIYAEDFFNSCQSNAFAYTFFFLVLYWHIIAINDFIIFLKSNIWIKTKKFFRKALRYWLLISCILFFWQCCRAAYSSERQRSCQFCFSKLSWIDRTREVACAEMQFIIIIIIIFLWW